MNGWFFKGAQTNSLRYFSPAISVEGLTPLSFITGV
jgi:hypothetical protein